ncbi:L,D-transpeptidase [Aneurinibacillus terranovensis]|uniref:L,D-transpeptidase n=1 Tax=Aneurinibacillus terranovensis TaxID=278991 RepID=UPI000404668D|nr:L,D-transpeptidase [Aneurinibacillus terranovensis]
MKNGSLLLLLSMILCLMTFLTVIPVTCQAMEDEMYLQINKQQNRLTVYVNDTPVYKFPVATGKTVELTPVGEYKIVTRVKNPWYLPQDIPGGDKRNPLGTRWMGLNVPGTNGYKYGIHGTNNERSIGYAASSGCIRMHNEDVEWLFRHVQLQTKVVIVEK